VGKISKKYKNFLENFKVNCGNYCNKGFRRWRKWAVCNFLGPGKMCVLIAILITLFACGVGFYGLLILILLVLLFIFI
jgi:hypothetical protein